MEFNETLAAALQRELREEFGVEIAVGELLDVVDHILPDEGQHWVSPTYVCRITAGAPRIREPGKCAAVEWFAPDAVPEDLTEISRANLRHYRARLGREAARAAPA